MQILADRLRQNYPECRLGKMSEDMNLKRPLFYQNGTEFRKNKVYIARTDDLTLEQLAEHGDNLILAVGDFAGWSRMFSAGGQSRSAVQYDTAGI